MLPQKEYHGTREIGPVGAGMAWSGEGTLVVARVGVSGLPQKEYHGTYGRTNTFSTVALCVKLLYPKRVLP